jgi:hypothetical protein
MNKTLQCKHIPTKPILEFLFQRRKDGKIGCCWMDGYENSIGQAMPPDIPGKLKRSKMQGLIERDLVSGCGYCRSTHLWRHVKTPSRILRGGNP